MNWSIHDDHANDYVDYDESNDTNLKLKKFRLPRKLKKFNKKHNIAIDETRHWDY